MTELFYLVFWLVFWILSIFSCKSNYRDSVVCPSISTLVRFIKSHQDQVYSSINFIHQLTLITIHLFNFSSPLSQLVLYLIKLSPYFTFRYSLIIIKLKFEQIGYPQKNYPNMAKNSHNLSVTARNYNRDNKEIKR